MKISYRTIPFLENIFQEKLGMLKTFDADINIKKTEHEEVIRYIWDQSISTFKENIFIITEPFFNAIVKNFDKLNKLYKDLQVISIHVVLIFKNSICLFHYEEIPGRSYWNFMEFTKTGEIICYKLNDSSYKAVIWASKELMLYYEEISSDMNMIINWQMDVCITTYLFRLYADVETKLLPPNRRFKDISCKYANDTKLPITVLDCKWFTNLVQSNAFKVRGHFRLQPCGPLLQDRKLIWINEFEKSGYHSQAKIISQ